MAIVNFISTVWSENLLKQLDRKYIGVLNCNREFEGDIKNQGSIVKICGVDDVTVSDYTKNSDMTSPVTSFFINSVLRSIMWLTILSAVALSSARI